MTLKMIFSIGVLVCFCGLAYVAARTGDLKGMTAALLLGAANTVIFLD